MATRRAIRGVLGNLLGTYTSRYSDYDGYWLFGLLVADLDELRIDLLQPPASGPGTPSDIAVRWAAAKFEDQLLKSGLARPQVREAWLVLRKLAGSVMGEVNGNPCIGHRVAFSASVIMDNGRHYERECGVFVASHNPSVEQRRAVTASS